ncbi:hypothetical protein EYF80_034067 [Liparis tanakae]|uniref:Uncharacterized protein n=1 Tax=Liparis tanakae TaxID=230148 RepID=A0A4Z2GSK1_9TELE|nr:hypothetical protein EYF80_034067 [Liparis tanakae]
MEHLSVAAKQINKYETITEAGRRHPQTAAVVTAIFWPALTRSSRVQILIPRALAETLEPSLAVAVRATRSASATSPSLITANVSCVTLETMAAIHPASQRLSDRFHTRGNPKGSPAGASAHACVTDPMFYLGVRGGVLLGGSRRVQYAALIKKTGWRPCITETLTSESPYAGFVELKSSRIFSKQTICDYKCSGCSLSY